jgi:hypothetical protein
MTDDGTPGVLLEGEDGSHYFIPQADLSQYSVGSVPEVAADVSAAAPRLDAFAVERTTGDDADDLAFFPMPEG